MPNNQRSNAGEAKFQVATFYVGDFYFGLKVLRVQEILVSQKMTLVPLAPPVIEGLINLRGQIVPALDMRRRLGLEPRPAAIQPMNVIVRTEEGAVSLIVDEIGEVLDLVRENLEAPPPNVAAAAREIIESVYKLGHALLLLLDTDKTIDLGTTAHSVTAVTSAVI